jgi:hypothetical protein
LFNENHIIPDSIFRKYNHMDIEDFFQKINSPLKGYKVDGELVSSIIEKVCREEEIDPRFILTKLQVEQSLLHTTPTREKLDWALGFGCLDSGNWLEQFRGFSKQVKAAARGIKSYLVPSDTHYIGDLLNKKHQVSDGEVKCKNAATAALYRYTPWIGIKDHSGKRAPFGNYLFFKVWTGLFGPVNLSESQQAATSDWKVIAPPDNWRDPIIVSKEELVKFEKLAKMLRLATNKDVSQKKFYLGLAVQPATNAATMINYLKYPSGEFFPIISSEQWDKPRTKYGVFRSNVAPPLIKLTPESRKKKLSQNFTLGEFACHDPIYELIRVSPLLIEKLERIRAEAGGLPVKVTSSYRPYPYNAAIPGAAENSCHVDGIAADIYIDGVSVTRLYTIADKVIGDGGGVGIYQGSNFVHVDVRGERARW